MVEYCEIFKMAFAKILDFLPRYRSSKLAPKLPQGISNDWESQKFDSKLLLGIFFYPILNLADTLPAAEFDSMLASFSVAGVVLFDPTGLPFPHSDLGRSRPTILGTALGKFPGFRYRPHTKVYVGLVTMPMPSSVVSFHMTLKSFYNKIILVKLKTLPV